LKIYGIACDKSGYPAIVQYIASDHQDICFTSIVKVPCLGVIKESEMLEALETDCDILLLAGCPLDSCHNLQGSRFAQRRAIKVNRLLEEAETTKRVYLSFGTSEKIAELKRVLDLARTILDKQPTT